MGMACNVADAGSMAVHAVGLRRGSRVQMCARYARPVWTVTQLLQHARPLRTLTLRDSDAFLKTLKYQGFELVSRSRKCQCPQRPGVLGGLLVLRMGSADAATRRVYSTDKTM